MAQNAVDKPALGEQSQTVGTGAHATNAFGALESADEQAVRLICGGIAAVLAYEALNCAVLAYLTPQLVRPLAPIVGFEFALTAFMMGLTWTGLYRRHWRALTFGLAATLVACATTTSIIRNDQIAFFISILLMCMGTAIVAPWQPYWQLAFSAICIAAMGLNTIVVPDASGYLAYRWAAVAVAAVLAQFAVTVGERYRRRNETLMAKLRQNEEELWKVFEANPDVVTISRYPDGRCLNVSSEFLKSGYAREDAIGKTDAELGIWADEVERKKFHAKLEDSGQVRNMEVMFHTRGGKNIPCLISGVVVQLSRGPSIITVTRDIGRIKRTEQQLIEARQAAEAASRAKSEFLSNMSHEIRTPMNSILGMAELLNETPLADDQRKYLSIISNNGNALLDLINDILDLARVESGRLTLETAEFDLLDLAERVAESLSIRSHQKGLELAVRVASEVPATVMGDALRLRQVLVNLLGNALKFTEHGEIVLQIALAPDAPGMLHFSVADTGIGVPEDQRERVFASYAQAESSTARKYGGTGLGLAIVKRLVELMGGRIWVESAVGQGSTFHFTARLEAAAHAMAAANATGGAEAPDLTGTPILIVDDTAVNRIAIGELLSRRGAVVTTAVNGADALAALDRAQASGAPYRIALLDCRIPGTDTYELARQIGQKTFGATKVLPMLTTDRLNIQLPSLRQLGLNHHVIKPARRGELLQAISALLRDANGADAPITTDDPQTVAGDAIPNAAETPFRILLADDSRDNRLLIEAFLRRTPYRIETAENGKVAVRKFLEKKFDIVLMDIQMPEMDGYEATRAIREWERKHNRPRTPIIALTASVLDEAVHKSLEAGCNTHMSKPVRRQALLQTIREIMTDDPASHGDRIETREPNRDSATAGGVR